MNLMKKGNKKFRIQRRKVIKYNKAQICTFLIFMLYALVYSLLMLDCRGISFSTPGKINANMIKCNNLFPGLLAFFKNNNITICCVLGSIGLIFLIFQKMALNRINALESKELNEEKVKKYNHILLILLLGYTGIHKFKTENRVIGRIYLTNFILLIITLLIKCFFTSTYNEVIIFQCTYEFSLLMFIGIIVFNLTESIFVLLSKKDEDGRIFA
jgi:hypothetical protein